MGRWLTGLFVFGTVIGAAGCSGGMGTGPHIPRVSAEDQARRDRGTDLMVPGGRGLGTPSKCPNAGVEHPVAINGMGKGLKYVRIVNLGHFELRVRLLDAAGGAVHAGTLSVDPGRTGKIFTGSGRYMLRFRDEGSCVVKQGAVFQIPYDEAGVAVSIKFSTASTTIDPDAAL